MFDFDQARTLSVRGAALPTFRDQCILTPVRLSGTETLGELFKYTLELKTPDSFAFSPSLASNIDLNSLIGTEITCLIEIEGNGQFIVGMAGSAGAANIGATTREISGLISSAYLLRGEGRSIVYGVTIVPWLWLATKNQDSRLFQDMSVIEITDAVLGDYTFPVEKRLIEQYPKRDIQRQHWESDFVFLARLWQEWGIYFWFDHSDGVHRLVLCDSIGAHKPHGEAYETIRYEAPTGKRIDEEHIHSLNVINTLTTGGVASVDYDYTLPRADLTSEREDPRDTAFARQEHYDWGDYAQPQAGATGLSGTHNDPQKEARLLALVRAQALRCIGLRATGTGNLRGLTTGQTFNLTHALQEKSNREYLVVSSTLEIENVAEESLPGNAPTNGQRYRCVTNFVIQPSNEPFRSQRTIKKPRTHGPETAMVVGPDNQEIWTDAYGRIKVQYMWDREGNNDERSSCWMRVSSPWQGNQFGAIHLPRIGQEVIVDHLRGDPDLPIVTGRVVNAFQMPNWKLPDQQALSGFVSKELNGGLKNVWVNDDTTGQTQTQIRSAHMASGLHMGYITRISEPAGRQEKRGEGAELRTDGKAAIRAAQGLLLTTFARPAANGDAFSVDEVNEQLAASCELADNLAQTAQTAGANDGEQKNVATLLKDQARAIKGNGELAQFNDPQLVLASPTGATVSTPEQIHLSSGRATAVTAGTDLSVSTGGTFLASMRRGMRFLAYEIGIRMIAVSGDISIKALKDSINIIAKLNVTMTANKILINAKEELQVGGGGSYTCWKAGQVTTGTTGDVLFHSASRTFTKPDNIGKPQLPESIDAPANLSFALGALPGSASRYVNEPYELYKGTEKIAQGVTDEYGRIIVKNHEIGTPAYMVKTTNGGKFDLDVKDALNASTQHSEFRTNVGERLV